MPRTHNGEKIISTNHAEKIGYALVGRMRLDPYLTPQHKTRTGLKHKIRSHKTTRRVHRKKLA